MTTRSLVSLLVLAIASAALLGCGAEPQESSASPEALAKVRASDYARAVGLHASDLPYFEQIPEEDEEDPRQEERNERRLKRCLGAELDSEEPLAEVKSFTYGTSSPGTLLLRVQSIVSVAEDADSVARELRLLRGRRATGCFRRVYLTALEEEESGSADLRRASVERIADPLPDAEGSFGYRFSAVVTVHGDTSKLAAHGETSELVARRRTASPAESRTVPVYVDIVGFVSGPVSVSLTATGAPSPVSKHLERNLLSVLHERTLERRP